MNLNTPNKYELELKIPNKTERKILMIHKLEKLQFRIQFGDIRNIFP